MGQRLPLISAETLSTSTLSTSFVSQSLPPPSSCSSYSGSSRGQSQSCRRKNWRNTGSVSFCASPLTSVSCVSSLPWTDSSSSSASLLASPWCPPWCHSCPCPCTWP